MIPLFPLAILTDRPEAADFVGLFSLVYFFGFVLLIVPYSIALTIASPIINYRFALNESIGDALDIGAITKDFLKNWQNVIVVALITIGIQSFAWIGVVLFIVGVLFTILYSYMVPAYLSGMLYRDTLRKERFV
jgi:Na+(H+)/acetate symporter ActP